MKVSRKNAAIKEERSCKHCSKAFFEYPKIKHNYCSKVCCYESRVGKKQINGLTFRKEQPELQKRSPIKWKEMLDKCFPDVMVRRAIACIIFWDYFDKRDVTKRWDQLDEYIAPHFNTTSNQRIRSGLMRLGYTHENAEARIGD